MSLAPTNPLWPAGPFYDALPMGVEGGADPLIPEPVMDGVKSPLQSLTVTTGTGAAIATVIGLAGVQVDPAIVTEGVNQVLQLVSLVLTLVAVYGRLKATTRLTTAATPNA